MAVKVTHISGNDLKPRDTTRCSTGIFSTKKVNSNSFKRFSGITIHSSSLHVKLDRVIFRTSATLTKKCEEADSHFAFGGINNRASEDRVKKRTAHV